MLKVNLFQKPFQRHTVDKLRTESFVQAWWNEFDEVSQQSESQRALGKDTVATNKSNRVTCCFNMLLKDYDYTRIDFDCRRMNKHYFLEFNITCCQCTLCR